MALPSSAWSRVPMCRQADSSTGLESGVRLSGKEHCSPVDLVLHATRSTSFKLHAAGKQVCTATWMLS